MSNVGADDINVVFIVSVCVVCIMLLTTTVRVLMRGLSDVMRVTVVLTVMCAVLVMVYVLLLMVVL